MGAIGEMIVTGGRRAAMYTDRLLKDVRPDQFARKPRGPTGAIDTNHPAWIMGHLGLYPARLATALGVDAAKMTPPASFDALFKDGTPCVDDADGKTYPSMDAIVSQYKTAHESILSAVAALDDKVLAAVNPDEKSRPNFPTVGARVMFMLNNHVMMHMGQFSAWRRCMGLGPA